LSNGISIRPGARGTSHAGFAIARSRLRFGVFEVHFRERELRKFGLRVKLQQKPFQILERLLRTPGEFVGREELAQLLWPDLHVLFDRSLNTAINALRRALGDAGRDSHFIETRSGMGYRFIAPVEQIADAAAASRPHRGNSQAYQDCLKGRYFLDKMTEQDIRKSVAYFESALSRDSVCAPAYAGLADTWILLAFYGARPPEEYVSRAREFAEAALRSDDTLAEAHTAIANVKTFGDWDWAGAEREYQRALQLDPENAAAHCSYARFLSAMSRFDEAMKEIGVAQELDPLSLIISVEMAWILYAARDFSESAEQSWKTLAMEPRFAPAQNTLGLAYEQLGMMEEAIVELDNARVCSENHPASVAVLARVLAVAGRIGEAEEWLASLRRMSHTRHISPYWLSCVYAGLGKYDLAFQSLQQALSGRDAWLAWLNVDPRFDALRHDSHFKDLLRRMGIASA